MPAEELTLFYHYILFLLCENKQERILAQRKQNSIVQFQGQIEGCVQKSEALI